MSRPKVPQKMFNGADKDPDATESKPKVIRDVKSKPVETVDPKRTESSKTKSIPKTKESPANEKEKATLNGGKSPTTQSQVSFLQIAQISRQRKAVIEGGEGKG